MTGIQALGLRGIASRDLVVGRAPQESGDLTRIADRIAEVVLGKAHVVRLALASMLAGGHVLIEDVPGVGKTTLAQTIARVLGLGFQRVQFTADLLPADILGISVFNQRTGCFDFHPGPVFAQVVLADEVNRATPKTQSALLEAMEERQVTQDGVTRALPEPFFVIATQNPLEQVGTFPLPESQLDRFLMCLELGYPDPAAERALLTGDSRRTLIGELEPVIEPGRFRELQRASCDVHASDALLDYVQALLAHSRRSADRGAGLSPRAGLALLGAARAWALLAGRDHALPEDVQAVFTPIVSHRLAGPGHTPGSTGAALAAAMLEQVPVP